MTVDIKFSNTSEYVFVIDTDKYVGNFEREITVYCVGAIGKCEVGEEYVEEILHIRKRGHLLPR